MTADTPYRQRETDTRVVAKRKSAAKVEDLVEELVWEIEEDMLRGRFRSPRGSGQIMDRSLPPPFGEVVARRGLRLRD
jgi:hypothetical protein